MKFRFAPDQQDPFGGAFNPTDAEFNSGFMPFAAGSGVHGDSHDAPPTTTPALTGEAISSAAAFTGTAATVVVSSLGVGVANANGFNIDLVFDAAAAAAPAFMSGIEQAAMILGQTITNKITVNINIDYGGTGGGASAGPASGQFVNYSTVRADLIANAAPGDTTFNALPTGSTIGGQSQVAVWDAQLKLFGLLAANGPATDGSATFATDIASNALVGVALHELTHALGRVPYGSQPDIFDLYRFTSPAPSGTYLFTSNIPASAAYFSLNGGVTKIADYGQNSDPSDFLNSGVQGSNDPFDEYYTPGSTLQTLTAIDKEQIDALGFNTMTVSQSIAVVATTSEAVQGGAAVALLGGQPTITDSASTTLSSATIKIANAGSSAVVGDKLYVNGIQNGSLGSGVTASWNATTNTLTLTGSASLAVYDTLLSEVTYQDTGTDSSTGSHPVRTVTWSANDGTASFNTTSQITVDRAPVVSATNGVLGSTSTPVAASSLFTASDSDGDAIATYAFKDSGNGHFILNGVAQANNQEIDVTATQLAQLTYLGTGGVDSLQVRVNDGTAWGSWQGFTVTTTVVQSISVAATATEAVQGGAAVALLGEQPTITDSASTTLSSATIKIANVGSSAVAGDKLYVNGIQNGSLGNGVTASWNATTDSLTLTGSASLAVYDTLLSEVTYQDTGIDSSTGSHPVRTVTWTANDGTASFNTTSQITLDRAPVETVANVVLNSNTTPVAASSLFTASDSDGDAIATYAFMDSGNGRFILNGVVQANNQEIDVTAAQLSQLTYVDTGGVDTLQVRVNDGTTWNAWNSFTATAPTVVTVTATNADLILLAGQSIAASSLFTGSTSPGDTILAYQFYDSDNVGNFVVNGVVEPNVSGSFITISAVQLAETTFQAGNGQADLYVRAFDGTTWSGGASFDVGPADPGPVVTATNANVTLAAGQSIAASSLFTATASPGHPILAYQFYDSDNVGNFVVNGVVEPNVSGSFITITVAQLAETTFEAGTGQADLYVRAFDGTTWSSFPSFDVGPSDPGPAVTATNANVTLGVGQSIAASSLFTATAAPGHPILAYQFYDSDNVGNFVVNGVVEPNVSGSFITISTAQLAETTFQAGNGQADLYVRAFDGTTWSNFPSFDVTGGSGISAQQHVADTGPATIGTGATLELAAVDSGSVTFSGATGMLILDHSTAFSGQIFDSSGSGILASSDQVDLRDINPNASGFTDSYSNGVLTVSDGTNTAHLDFFGTCAQDNFSFASDGHGGTIISDPPAASPNTAVGGGPTGATTITATSANQTLTGAGSNDGFVFNFAPGHATITNFQPASDVIQIDHALFANVQALLAAAQNDGHGDVIITADAQDTITLQNVTLAQLQAHQSGFHIT